MADTTHGCPVIPTSPTLPASFDALLSLDPATLRCPYPVYQELRHDAPVCWSDRLSAFVVSRYDDVVKVLMDPRTFSSVHQSGRSSVTGLAQRLLADPKTPPDLLHKVRRRLEVNAKPALINADPPVHVRQRKLVSYGFTPRRVGLMEPEIRRVATELIDSVRADGSMDFVRQYAMPLPMTVIANVLGVPPDRQHDFKRWSNAFTQGLGALQLSTEQVADLFAAVDEFYDYFTEQIEARRTQPRDDLLTDLVDARLEGELPLTVNEMLQMLVVFLVGGNETTTNLLTWMTHRLLTDPALMQRVRADLRLLPALAEEMLRLQSPVQGLFRTATADTEVGGVPIPKDGMLFLIYASGNHDDTAFATPDHLDLDRDASRPHLAFGRGEHFCLGASVARLEARVGMELLLTTFGDLALAGSADRPLHSSFVLHGLRDLPVTFSPV
jgi:cytochrome P450